MSLFHTKNYSCEISLSNICASQLSHRAGGSNLVMIHPSCQPYLESRAHKLLGGFYVKFLKMRCQNMFFFLLLAWKIYCTLHSKVYAAQNDLTWNLSNWTTSNSPELLRANHKMSTMQLWGKNGGTKWFKGSTMMQAL